MRARMWPAWYFLTRARATDKFDMRARAARVASWDRNVGNSIGFIMNSQVRDETIRILVEDHWALIVFLFNRFAVW